MKASDFEIGDKFVIPFTGDRYRITDVGSRVIVAICISSVRYMTLGTDSTMGRDIELTQSEAEARGWFRGPPYAVAERVFDEDDLAVIKKA